MADKNKKMKKVKGSKNGTSKKSKKAQRQAEREAKRAARKGDGSFPDTLVVTREKNKETGKRWFYGHDGEDLSTLYDDGQVVAVYKLRKVSKISIKRKIER